MVRLLHREAFEMLLRVHPSAPTIDFLFTVSEWYAPWIETLFSGAVTCRLSLRRSAPMVRSTWQPLKN
jgi:hypothetical protein